MAQENVTVSLCRPYRKALATNANTSSFASKVPTLTEPSGDGIVTIAPGTVPQWLKCIPYGLGDADNTFNMQVIGWGRLPGSNVRDLWVPTVLAGVSCTLGTAAGVAGGGVLDTEKFCDTITITSGFEPTVTADVTRGGTIWTFSPVNNLVGFFCVQILGVEKLEFIFDQTSGTPTMNSLITLF